MGPAFLRLDSKIKIGFLKLKFKIKMVWENSWTPDTAAHTQLADRGQVGYRATQLHWLSMQNSTACIA